MLTIKDYEPEPIQEDITDVDDIWKTEPLNNDFYEFQLKTLFELNPYFKYYTGIVE